MLKVTTIILMAYATQVVFDLDVSHFKHNNIFRISELTEEASPFNDQKQVLNWNEPGALQNTLNSETEAKGCDRK